ncbi:citrate lyase holo-[acyl-carrier protein] synthase [Ewingella americana]|uniref:Apo-citrate lyase phosphoribosyl-dephospho-CoA transferase n=1 Tax=Ewingella americana TaxID=41202 RepID=A0A502GQB7_9GAMM|nr:citrate lyase holo-[acyl-carrier protein] synthase [Ewingella americana]TPG63480.1 citrate lyase holo-[acyl-carrier protein] synthase [Ewingella americana]
MHAISPLLAANRAVSLPELLTSRESRQTRQRAWLARHHCTLISLTMVMPGAVKDTTLSRELFCLAWQALETLSQQRGWPWLAWRCLPQDTGSEGLIALDVPAQEVKQATLALEDNQPLGRLWDIDVLDASGAILSRRDFGLPARHCLLCAQPANQCGREQKHSTAQLLGHMQRLFDAAAGK